MVNEARQILSLLGAVQDPEIPVLSVLDLGIVREVRPGTPPTVVITPTYTGCPAARAIELSIRAALDAGGFADVLLATELSPPWTTDWISEAGRAKLHEYGIAPPTARNQPPACPQCGSGDTEEISRFGSTPCKALHRCRTCREPFDFFKCH